ncbi:hypothetical protein BGW37DRAFT_274875 [Umbelopsis sp. PMI_123]|nr:hypothetical protein BGW37DRAFT_274875 [Umbelopsis sp. PMI_123]
MKLKVSGANMKDESAPLSSYGVHYNSVVELDGRTPGKEDLQEAASGNPEEVGLCLRISQTVEKLKESTVPVIEKYDKEVSDLIASGATDETKKRKLLDMSAYINEHLMQSLLTLDGIACEPEFLTARQRRREGVRYAQGLLDRLDKIKGDLRAFIDSHKA